MITSRYIHQGGNKDKRMTKVAAYEVDIKIRECKKFVIP